MATLIPAYGSCERRMTSGERRLALLLESLLEPDHLCWYDVPVDTKYEQPDFVLLHPCHGLLALEVRDWTLESIKLITPVTVTLLTGTGATEVANPLLRARQNAFGVKNALERDRQLVATAGHPKAAKLACPFGYGVVLAQITRGQFDAAHFAKVLPPHLVICRDEMTEGAAEAFRGRLCAMAQASPGRELTPAQIDRIRWHMFSDLRITQRALFADTGEEDDVSAKFLQVMDRQQERLARSLGEGHRVIHGVAGSGKTAILALRCAQLARTPGKPVLVLCYNVALAATLEQTLGHLTTGDRVTVRNFHRWCADQMDVHQVPKPKWNNDYPDALVNALIDAVDRGQVPQAQYGAVLVDEGHDFEPAWLALVSKMVDPASNSLLLLYDDAQSIRGASRPADFSFKSVGIHARGRTTILRVNYRNTDEILSSAYDFAKDILAPTDAKEDGVPMVKPQRGGRHGPSPYLIQLSSPKEEGEYIGRQLSTLHAEGMPWNRIAVLYRATFIADKIAAALGVQKIPVEWLRERHAKRFDPQHDSVKLMSLHSSKGLEFAVVAIAGLGFMPYKEDEAADEARLLYAAMTRATERLIMTASRDSSFVQKLIHLEAAA